LATEETGGPTGEGGGVHSGANRAVGSDGGGAEEQPRASARGSRELTASVQSSGGVGEFRGGPRRRFMVAQRWQHDSAVAAKGWRRKKGCSRGVLLL
jgi:hypothetical protein